MSALIGGIDPEYVGSICLDSTTYESMSDTFDMQNKVYNIIDVLDGRKTVVGKLRSDEKLKLVVKLYKAENNIIGVAECCGVKQYNMLNIEIADSKEFAWFYIDLLSKLAQNVRIERLLKSQFH